MEMFTIYARDSACNMQSKYVYSIVNAHTHTYLFIYKLLLFNSFIFTDYHYLFTNVYSPNACVYTCA